ncbi:MAG: YggS family pyridoxal phosphate-dependent enzyme [Alphaproteobacteria bacterium]|nr:YggS family pyridoxal phosphate-dependent enzyme [Alphaproteobacteria bacterium]
MPNDPAVIADTLAGRLAAVRAAIAEAARATGRDPSDVILVAVGKTYGAEVMEEAIAAGQRIFGENRVQEAAGKWPGLKARWPDIRLHLIGPLQTNKVKDVLGLFDVVQTLDRAGLAEALVKARDRGAALPELLVQVNTGKEPQKAGVDPAEADAFLARCRDEWRLPVTGLMCIPPADEPPALHFALLREIARRNGLDRLSMGMSGDYATAVRFGATMVRVGSAIFGARPSVTTG